MKVYVKNMLVLPLIIMLMASCNDDLTGLGGGNNVSDDDCYFYLVSQPASRVSYGNDVHSDFESGDRLGAFALNQDGQTLVEGQPENAIYEVRKYKEYDWSQNYTLKLVPAGDGKLDKNLPNYLFYYPYKEDMTFEKLKSLTHTVQLDQSTAEAYEASDLLWDVAQPQDNGVHVAMDHVMANIVVNFSSDKLSPVSSVELLSCYTTGTGINLLNNSLESLAADGQYKVAGDNSNAIKMHNINPESAPNERIFRAAVPANQTIKAGTDILLAGDGDYARKFRIKNSITLEPGKNYYFTIGDKPNYPIPGDDDSWVLDVKDKDGNLVGLLCREYLVYQPSSTSAADEKTGEPFDDTKTLNTHAWVLYQLDANKVPILKEGKLMCFLYDFEYRSWCRLPAPNISTCSAGIFSMPHGCRTIHSDGIYVTGSEVHDYGMVGGTVIWKESTTESIISKFIMPEKTVSNDIALVNGHITATGDGGCDLSYIPENEDPEHCFIFPRYVHDSRDGKSYPLVKIGYNQFWISKSIDYAGEINGSTLKCYNSREGGITIKYVTNESGVENRLAPGYLYPVYIGEGEDTYDPYSEGIETTPFGDSNYTPIKMYNLLTMGEAIIPPLEQSDRVQGGSYHLPTSDDAKILLKYVRGYPIAKLTARYRTPVYGNAYFLHSVSQAMRNGECRQGNVSNPAYTGNVSGFNVRGLGEYAAGYAGGNYNVQFEGISYNMPGIDGVICLNEPAQLPRVKCMNLHNWSLWDANALQEENSEQCAYSYTAAGTNEVGQGSKDTWTVYTKTFAQVRIFMSFDQSNLRPRSTRGCSSRSSLSRSQSNDVVFMLEACD